MPARPNNLPLQVTSFVGRTGELAAVKDALARTRLVTLTGPGGCGKTRLALQVASDLVEAFADGVWIVELAPLSDAALVPQAALAALGAAEAPARPAIERLTAFLEARRTLLVLDNCEHLVEACAHLADALIRACPGLTILATSRERLGIAGEAAWRVPPLTVPAAAAAAPADRLASYEAVQLFVERAVLVQRGFAVTTENAPALADVCRRLDGLPLALELAAARVRVLSVAEIAGRLDDRFRLLTGGSRTARRRQQTLRAMLDWSHDLLGAPERVLLRRLAVFAGGWTLEAAEQVCAAAGGAQVRERDVLDVLTGLVDKSLVMAEAQGGETRYRLLETVRQYAEENLLAAGEAAAVRDRHAAYYAALAEAAAPQLWGRDAPTWVGRLRREHGNLRAVLQWAESARNADLGLRTAGALHWFWQANHRTEGRAWLERLLAVAGDGRSLATRGRALNALSALAAVQLDSAAAQAAADESLRLAHQSGGKAEIAAALFARGYATFRYAWLSALPDEQARAARLFEESRGIAQEIGDHYAAVRAISYQARALKAAGDHDGAVRLAGESLALARELGDRFTTSWMLQLLADESLARAEGARARALGQEALGLAQVWDASTGAGGILVAHALRILAHVDFADGDVAAGRARCRQGVALFRDVDEQPNVVNTIEELEIAAVGDGAWTRAIRLAGWVSAVRATTGLRPPPPSAIQGQLACALDAARRGLGEPEATAAWQAGGAMSYDEAVAYALEEYGVERGATGARPRLPQGLTVREAEVLRHVAAGATDRQIAAALVVSEETVGRHLTHIFRKLDVASRAGASAFAVRHGLA